jgi:hypothetical protein
MAGPFGGHARFGAPWGGGPSAWSGLQLPAELSGLRDIPEPERFAHFKGGQITLTDKDGQPLQIAVTPGTATAVSATSLTMDANSSGSQTFALNAQTMIPGHGEDSTTPSITQGDKVVVVTVNGSTTATAVWSHDLASQWHGGPFGRH